MKTREQRYADVLVLELSGAIDQAASAELQALLLKLMRNLATDSVGVTIDMAEVPYVSSAGLRILMIAAKEYGKSGRGLALACLKPCVREVFQISRFDKVIPTFTEMGEALASMSPAACAAFNARASR